MSASGLPKAVAVLARERDHLLEQQTAIADLLGIISRSKFELLPVLQTVVDTAVRLCRATSGEIFGLEKGVYRFAVGCNLDPAYVRRQKPIAPGPGTMVGRTALARQVAKIDDLLADPRKTLQPIFGKFPFPKPSEPQWAEAANAIRTDLPRPKPPASEEPRKQ